MYFKMKSEFETEFQNPTIQKNAKMNYDILKIRFFYFLYPKYNTFETNSFR